MTNPADFYRSNGYSTETLSKTLSDSNNPYTFAHRTGGTSLWSFLSDRSERQRIFDEDMAAQQSAVEWTIGIYPFASEVPKY